MISTVAPNPELLSKYVFNNELNSTEEFMINKYISDATKDIALNVVMVTLCGFVSVFGIIGNVINITVFIRMGVFAESSNVSLLGLSVADFMCVLSMFWASMNIAMAINKPPNIPWEPFDIFYISGAWPRVITGMITRVVTTFVALERCVCVVFPFKVKAIFTPRFSLVSMISIFVYFLISYSPVYYYNQFRYNLDPKTNRTMLSLATLPGFVKFDAIVSIINLFSINFGSVAMVLLCTMITVSRVKMSRVWRESLATGNTSSAEESKDVPNADIDKSTSSKGKTQPSKMSASKLRKEKKLILMISAISIIFLICYIPNLTITIMYSINNQITTKGHYQNLAWVMFSIIFLSETINSSINILIYYRMSSRFKQEFNRLLGRGDNEK